MRKVHIRRFKADEEVSGNFCFVPKFRESMPRNPLDSLIAATPDLRDLSVFEVSLKEKPFRMRRVEIRSKDRYQPVNTEREMPISAASERRKTEPKPAIKRDMWLLNSDLFEKNMKELTAAKEAPKKYDDPNLTEVSDIVVFEADTQREKADKKVVPSDIEVAQAKALADDDSGHETSALISAHCSVLASNVIAGINEDLNLPCFAEEDDPDLEELFQRFNVPRSEAPLMKPKYKHLEAEVPLIPALYDVMVLNHSREPVLEL